MTHTISELIPTEGDYLQNSLEAFGHVLAIIEISALVLIAIVVLTVILACCSDPKEQERERPARTQERDQGGQVVHLADWGNSRTEESWRRGSGRISTGPLS